MSEFEPKPYSFELLPEEPILIARLYASFSQQNDLDPYLNESVFILNSQDRPVYYITDLSECKLRVFMDFLIAVNRTFRGHQATINHPNIAAPIIASTNNVIKLGAKSLDSETYGHLSIPVFDTLEEALIYARALISQE